MILWKDIKNYENRYQISNTGQVRNILKDRVLKPLNVNGYRCVSLSVGGNRKSLRINRLVALAFIPNPHKKPNTNHKNGIKDDNRVENLEWCTQKENVRHALENGLHSNGERHGNSKLKEKDVLRIREMAKTMKLRDISKEFPVTEQQISQIVRRLKWNRI